jgi:signal transduction histidine kinase/CHASE1-domain containing sensor protein
VTRVRPALRSVATTLGIALAYLTTAKLGLLLAVPPGYATAVWPPSGISLGALLVYGRRHWPGVLLGSFLANMSTSFEPGGPLLRPLCVAAAVGLGAALQAALGARLIERFASSPRPLTRERDIFVFFVLGGPLACLLNASWGVSTLYLAGAIPLAACAYSWWTWWVGDTIGALIFAPLTVMWLSDDPQWRSRRVTISMPLAVTFAAAILLFVYASRSETHKLAKRFEEDAGRLASDLSQRLALDTEKLAAVQALFAASSQVEAREFQRFAEVALAGHPEILSLGWVPLIAHEQRWLVERELAQRGLAPLGIWERSGTRSQTRGPQSSYAPSLFMEPHQRFRQLFGFDMLSDPERSGVLARARDSGRLSSSGPFTTLVSRRPLDSFFLVRPIYATELPAQPSLEQRRRLLRGYATCGFRSQEFVEVSLRGVPGQDRIRLHIEDVGPDGQARKLYRSQHKAEKRLGFDYRRALVVGDHRWLLTFEPTLSYVVDEKSLLAWFVLAGGLIVCGLVGAGGLVLTGRTAAVELLVRERTAELADTNAKLASEIHQHVFTAQVLEQERSYLKAVLENLSEGIVVLGPHGETTLTNEAARNMQRLLVAPGKNDASPFSYGLRQSDGKSPLLRDELPTVRALRGETVRDFELISVCPGRPPHILMVTCQPLRGADSLQNGAVAVIRDITDSREAERMKSEFVSTVSHELRTPLTSIRGSLRLLAAGVMGELPLAATEMIQIASRNGERLAALINDLLDMEKIAAGRLEFTMAKFSLATLLRQSVELNAGYAQAHEVRLALTRVPEHAWVNVDDSRFLQVMTNLLSNAAKFSPAGCTVEVGAHLRGPLLRIEVRDQGPGIDEAFVPRVFARFSQADATDARAKGGTGLGLAISKALVEQMGGRIGFESVVGEGTTFYVELPSVDAPAAAATG